MEKRAAEAHTRFNAPPPISDPKSIVYTDHEDPFHRADDEGRHIYSLSPLAWVPCGNGKYVLELLKKGHIRIVPDGMHTTLAIRLKLNCFEESEKNRYTAWFTPASFHNKSEGAPPLLRSRALLKAANLAEAVRGADTYATRRVYPIAG